MADIWSDAQEVDLPQAQNSAPVDWGKAQEVDWSQAAEVDLPGSRQYTQTEAALGGLAKGAIPGAAGAAAGVYGAGVGAGAGGLVAGPPGAVVGGIIGGLGGAFGTSFGLGAIQDKLLAAMGWDEPFKEMERQHPTTFMLSEMAPSLAVARPNLKSIDAANRAIGAAVGGGIEGAQQLYEGDFDAKRLGANIAAGAIFSRTNRLGDRVQELGVRQGQAGARPYADPQRVAAHDFWQAGKHDGSPSYRGSNTQPDPNDLPPPSPEDMLTFNDVTPVARGVAAENGPAPQNDLVGNPDGSPGPHKAKGPDSSYIKSWLDLPEDPLPRDVQSGFEDTGLAEASRSIVQRGDVQPDVSAAIGVIPDAAPIDTGLAQASVPFMITRQMKAELRALGLNDDQIKNLTPEKAHAFLKIGREQAPVSESLRANLDDNYGVPTRGRRLRPVQDEHLQDVQRAETEGMQRAGARHPDQGAEVIDRTPDPAIWQNAKEVDLPENMSPRGGAPTQEELYGTPPIRQDNVGPFSPEESASLNRGIQRMEHEAGGPEPIRQDNDMVFNRGFDEDGQRLDYTAPQDTPEFQENRQREQAKRGAAAIKEKRQELEPAQQKELATFADDLEKRGLVQARERLLAIEDPKEQWATAERMAKALKQIREETGVDDGPQPKKMEVLANLNKDKNWKDRSHGLGKGPKKDKYYTSNGAEQKTLAVYERKQKDLDRFLKFFEDQGPDSERAKSLTDLTNRAEVRDYAKHLVADLTHEFGGKDPLERGNAYISTTKGHLDTGVIEYFRAAKRLATRNEDFDRFVDLHTSKGDKQIAGAIADERDASIRHQKGQTVPEKVQEDLTAVPAESTTEQFVGPRKPLKEFRDPVHKEANFYNAEQNELRDWVNQLSDEDYELLASRQDIKLDTSGLNDPGRILRKYINDLEVAKKEQAARISAEPPPVREGAQTLPPMEKPKPSEVRDVPADVRAQYAQQAAAEKLTPEQLAAFKARKEKLAAKPKEPQAEARPPEADDEIARLVKAQKADEESDSLIAKFASDESGAFNAKFIKNYVQQRRAARQAQQNPAWEAYGDSINSDVGKADRNTLKSQIEAETMLRNSMAAAEAAKMTPYKFNKIYKALERRDLASLPADLKKYYDDWIKPMRDLDAKVYQETYDINDKYKFRDMVDPSIVTQTDNVPRFGIGEDPGNALKIHDPFKGRGLSGYSPNIDDRGYFALRDAAGNSLTIKIPEGNKPDHFLVLRPGQPPQKVPFTAGFTGQLGQAVQVGKKGKQSVYTLDHATVDEIETATRRGVRYHTNPAWAYANRLFNNVAALEQMKLMAKLIDDGVIDSVVVTSVEEAKKRGYDTTPTRLTNTPLFRQYGNKDVYLPNPIRWELDDYSRPGIGGETRFIEGMRRIGNEFSKVFNLNAPWVHVLNEYNRYLVGRGAKWLNPVGTARHLADMPAAINDVLKRGPWQERMLDAGIKPLWPTTRLQSIGDAAMKSFQMEIIRNPSKWDPIFKVWGITAKEFYDKWYHATSHLTWFPIDVLTTMRFMEEVRNGWSDAEAAKRVNQWGADYSIKRTLMGSRLLQEGAVDPAVTLFGRWKRSLFESLASTTRNLVKGDPMLRDRAKRENFGDRMAEVKARQEALGQLMTIAVIAVGMGELARSGYNAMVGPEDKARKPWTVNRALEEATGRPGMELRPRGINAPVEKAAGVLAGTKGIGDVLTHAWSPNPAIQWGVDLLRQKDWRGEPITYKGNVFQNPGVIPENIGSVAEYLASNAAPIYGTLSRGYKKEGKLQRGLEDLAYEQFGINAPSEKAYRYQQKQEVYNNREQRHRNKNFQGIIPDLINSPFKR